VFLEFTFFEDLEREISWLRERLGVVKATDWAQIITNCPKLLLVNSTDEDSLREMVDSRTCLNGVHYCGLSEF
jgi:hypothetical protein